VPDGSRIERWWQRLLEGVLPEGWTKPRKTRPLVVRRSVYETAEKLLAQHGTEAFNVANEKARLVAVYRGKSESKFWRAVLRYLRDKAAGMPGSTLEIKEDEGRGWPPPELTPLEEATENFGIDETDEDKRRRWQDATKHVRDFLEDEKNKKGGGSR
jgi:hypothetical protein